jgi:putative transposase
MARLNRLCPVGIPQHIVQRGNNRKVFFNSDEDMAAYANWLKEFSSGHSCVGFHD